MPARLARGLWFDPRGARANAGDLPPAALSGKMASMKRFGLCSFSLLFAAMICTIASAQTPSGDKSDAAVLEALMKKIDLQNAKIDALSQHILKLDQHVSAIRPGVMIGETPAPATTTTTTEAPKPSPQTGNSHVVAKGETLTSIAKMHKVSVEELQRFNHIENDRKLQIGQTIMIPPSANGPSTTASPGG
ncbi:MAG TPA: LysM domain-containing protein [Chthoniobacterales bacterium]|nr:LysM domain-containing protein [Chthoniobacterales bacterium]